VDRERDEIIATPEGEAILLFDSRKPSARATLSASYYLE